jgi:sulfoxide reductase catalytic subunit YedY
MRRRNVTAGSQAIRPSEITPREVYLNRRQLLRAIGIGAALTAFGGVMPTSAASKLVYQRNVQFSTAEPPNSFQDITTYNNFYEFGTGKDDPAAHAGTLITHPWSVTVSGAAGVTGRFNLEDILKPHALEERIYRLRCVEAWSMVIPWVGIPLGDVLKRFQPTSRAKYVAFKTLLSHAQMPGQRYSILDWPYVEGLRIDEAMHPLSLLVVGLYGETLPNQNGAPLRLVVPWKYGFKGIKSIVEIHFTELQPPTSWSIAYPEAYGFYANVNPAVDHPNWSQARERRIGSGLFNERVPTQPFNGYATEVADLYRGMDLRRYY